VTRHELRCWQANGYCVASRIVVTENQEELDREVALYKSEFPDWFDKHAPQISPIISISVDYNTVWKRPNSLTGEPS